MSRKPKNAAGDRCVMCGRPFDPKPRRFCSVCKQQITRFHKWGFTADGRVKHRHCDNPTEYHPKPGTKK